MGKFPEKSHHQRRFEKDLAFRYTFRYIDISNIDIITQLANCFLDQFSAHIANQSILDEELADLMEHVLDATQDVANPINEPFTSAELSSALVTPKSNALAW